MEQVTEMLAKDWNNAATFAAYHQQVHALKLSRGNRRPARLKLTRPRAPKSAFFDYAGYNHCRLLTAGHVCFRKQTGQSPHRTRCPLMTPKQTDSRALAVTQTNDSQRDPALLMPQSGFGRLAEEVLRGLDPIYGNGCNVCRIAMISTMRTARPTTGSPLSVFEVGTAPFDPASSCFRPFCRLDPADPFIARERRNVLPRLQRFCVGGQCPFQVRGQVMDHTARDLFFAQSLAHKCIAGV